MTQEELKKFIAEGWEHVVWIRSLHLSTKSPYYKLWKRFEQALDELEKAVVVIEAGKDIIAQMELRELHDKGFDDLYKKADSVYKEALKKREGE